MKSLTRSHLVGEQNAEGMGCCRGDACVAPCAPESQRERKAIGDGDLRAYTWEVIDTLACDRYPNPAS